MRIIVVSVCPQTKPWSPRNCKELSIDLQDRVGSRYRSISAALKSSVSSVDAVICKWETFGAIGALLRADLTNLSNRGHSGKIQHYFVEKLKVQHIKETTRKFSELMKERLSSLASCLEETRHCSSPGQQQELVRVKRKISFMITCSRELWTWDWGEGSNGTMTLTLSQGDVKNESTLEEMTKCGTREARCTESL